MGSTAERGDGDFEEDRVIERVSLMVERIGTTIEKIHRIRQRSSLTWEVFQIVQERMAEVLLKHIKNPQIVDAICDDWGEISVPLDRNW